MRLCGERGCGGIGGVVSGEVGRRGKYVCSGSRDVPAVGAEGHEEVPLRIGVARNAQPLTWARPGGGWLHGKRGEGRERSGALLARQQLLNTAAVAK